MFVTCGPEFQPEFLSPEFQTKLILPGNDLILTCVPTESGNAAEFHGFRKMRPGRNWNTNGMHILGRWQASNALMLLLLCCPMIEWGG